MRLLQEFATIFANYPSAVNNLVSLPSYGSKYDRNPQLKSDGQQHLHHTPTSWDDEDPSPSWGKTSHCGRLIGVYSLNRAAPECVVGIWWLFKGRPIHTRPVPATYDDLARPRILSDTRRLWGHQVNSALEFHEVMATSNSLCNGGFKLHYGKKWWNSRRHIWLYWTRLTGC